MKPTNFPGRVEKRQKEAEQRRQEWSQLTPQEQLKALDERLGANEGAKKQRERLVKLCSQVARNAQSLVEAKVEKTKVKAKERRAQTKKAG